MKRNTPAVKARTAFLRKSVISLVLTFAIASIATAGFILNGGIDWRVNAANPQPTPTPSNEHKTNQISPEALKQIAALNEEKESRTPAQKKIDSRLLHTLKKARGQAIATGVPTIETGIAPDAAGNITVEIRANVTPALLARLKRINAKVIYSSSEYHSVQAEVPIGEIEGLAEVSEVYYIMPKEEGETSRTMSIRDAAEVPAVRDEIRKSGFSLPNTSKNRPEKFRRFLTNTVITAPVIGSTDSEGDTTHRASLARALSGADGTGIKIGVLSDGVDSLASRQASGDLPATVNVVPGQAGSGDEGTAMLEIVHDIAPGAQLYFARATPNSAQFAANIRALRTAGCDIIIDDFSYFAETPFQNGQAASVLSSSNGGVIVQAVNDVTASGALYFSSAANSGNKNDGTSGGWEGDFVNGGTAGSPLSAGLELHDFGGSTYNTVTAASTGATSGTYLKWSDPLGGSSNDYDLYVLDSTGSTVVASSTNVQSGTQDPIESVPKPAAGRRLVIVRKVGAVDRFLHLDTNRGLLSITTPGIIYGHNGGLNTISVAATPAGPAVFNVVGPFPDGFSSSNLVETFSSDGPRRIFYNADSTPITPGNVSSSGGQLLQKPDITAADGVTTTTPGFIPFFGTSAAAPHAGALAALLKSASPGSTNAQIYASMINGAIDIEAAGTDRDSGAGIFMPLRSMNLLGVVGPASLDLPPGIVASESSGNGNGQLDPGEHAGLPIQLNNLGLSNATAISATLTTSTPGVTISDSGVRSYPDISAAFGSATSATPFFFGLAPTFPCAGIVNFTLTVAYSGGTSPQTFNFSVSTGSPTSVSTTLDITPPPSGATYTAVSGSQTGRLSRSGVTSSCSASKSAPGLLTATGSRFYDAYTFTASGSGCTTVTVNTSTTNLYVAAYNASGFVPSNPNANFLADAGFSDTTMTFSFNVTAGQQYTIVVHEVDPAGGNGSNYSLQVTGPISGGCQILVPTAATVKVGGRVLTKDGRGIHKATVTITDMNGKSKSTQTKRSGEYSFNGLTVGQSYIVTAAAKGYQFTTRLVTPRGDLSDVDLIAQ